MAGPQFAETVYSALERGGVIAIIVAGFLSLLAVSYLLLTICTYAKKYSSTHLVIYFYCLLLADAMESFGAIMSLRWVARGGVEEGHFCGAQGGIKQAGSIAAAFWSFAISLHLFNLLFRRYETPKLMSWTVVAFGWSFVLTMVFLGPVAMETPERGRFFGISGAWCWITHQYHAQQIMMQYFFELLSMVLSFILYTVTLLRARGNLLKVDGRWKLRVLPAGESWKLEFGRDFTDSASLGLVRRMIWYPVAYAICILPIAAVRMCSIVGMEPPFGVTAAAAFIYNLAGFVDVVLFFAMHRAFPEAEALPKFVRRKTVDPSVMQYGITPFAFSAEPKSPPGPGVPGPFGPEPQPSVPEHGDGDEPRRRGSTGSLASINSQTPLRAV
ncbi:hypothetical protein DFH08DRAFT_352618 [Mycena albidolilacea]|uniref:G-protein coupled receptors family 2 profile 2 domain-containing protein n=1 Tax=Mycena albidolilacea TaxID=1033008 RepID=A0AAD6ZH75_9AGAR|nr:hypothetical protein DFH08DRAFT_352618 [Mycena albidolilacea]